MLDLEKKTFSLIRQIHIFSFVKYDPLHREHDNILVKFTNKVDIFYLAELRMVFILLSGHGTPKRRLKNLFKTPVTLLRRLFGVPCPLGVRQVIFLQ